MAPAAVHTRTLLPIWADALSSGRKPFEVQRYKQVNRNAMKFGERGALVIVSSKGSNLVVAVARVSAVVRDADTSSLAGLVNSMDDEFLKGALRDYMREGTSFDVMHFSEVFDLRQLCLTWSALELKLDCKAPRNSGFPHADLSWSGHVALQEILARSAAVKHQIEKDESRENPEELSVSVSTSEPDDDSSHKTESDELQGQPPRKVQKVWRRVT